MTLNEYTQIATFLENCFNSFFVSLLGIQVAGITLAQLLFILVCIGVAFSVIRKASK